MRRAGAGRAAAIGAAAWLTAAAAAAQSAATELFDGSFDGWSIENTQAGNIAIAGGLLRIEAPEGWLKSDGRYADFELSIEFRFLSDDADSGIFVRAVGDGTFSRGWPSRSYQVQLRNPLGESRFPPVGGIYRHGMPDGETDYDEARARRVSRPTGEWQTLVIRVDGERLDAALNGTHLTTAFGVANPVGFIGIQAETGALEFRSIAIREL